MQWLSFSWDIAGNLTNRVDTLNAVTETVTYGKLNRAYQSTVGSAVTNFRYDTTGNLTTKSDLSPGTYTYPTPGTGSVRPHAVSSITGTVNSGQGSISNPTYSYDANGNLLPGGGRTLTYTSFNVPNCIAAATICSGSGSSTEIFTYDEQHQNFGDSCLNGCLPHLLYLLTLSPAMWRWRNGACFSASQARPLSAPASGGSRPEPDSPGG